MNTLPRQTRVSFSNQWLHSLGYTWLEFAYSGSERSSWRPIAHLLLSEYQIPIGVFSWSARAEFVWYPIVILS